MSDFTEIMQQLSAAGEKIQALRNEVRRLEVDRDTWKNRAYGFALVGLAAVGCLLVLSLLEVL